LFRDRIKSAYDDLSPSFQRLADYLMDHPFEAAFMTATQLGRQLDMDTATVVRFAQRLDYPGYPELLEEIKAEVKGQLTRYFQPPPVVDSKADVYRAAIKQDIINIGQFDLTTDVHLVDRMISMIDSARRIIVVGDGMLSRPVAHMLANMLRSLGYNCAALTTDAGTIATEFQGLVGSDLVIGIAVTHCCPDATSILELARQRGAQTIAFVGAQSWPIARAAQVVVQCPSASPTRSASPSVFCVAIGVLYQTLFLNRREQFLDHYGDFERSMNFLTEARGAFEFTRPEWAAEAPARVDDV